MIRDAHPDDLPALVEMGAAFHAESPWAKSLAPYDGQSFAGTCRLLGERGGLLVAEEGGEVVGMIGASVVPLYFNAGIPVVQEVFWYALPEHRRGLGMALLAALENKALAAGARALITAAMQSLRGEAVSAVLGRAGYPLVERMHAKVFP